MPALSTSNKVGHWILLLKYQYKYERYLELFDSLCTPYNILSLYIRSFIENTTHDRFILSPRIIQNAESNFCGFYCIARSLSIIQNISQFDFYDNFSYEIKLNDSLVVQYITNLCNKWSKQSSTMLHRKSLLYGGSTSGMVYGNGRPVRYS